MIEPLFQGAAIWIKQCRTDKRLFHPCTPISKPKHIKIDKSPQSSPQAWLFLPAELHLDFQNKTNKQKLIPIMSSWSDSVAHSWKLEARNFTTLGRLNQFFELNAMSHNLSPTASKVAIICMYRVLKRKGKYFSLCNVFMIGSHREFFSKNKWHVSYQAGCIWIWGQRAGWLSNIQVVYSEKSFWVTSQMYCDSSSRSSTVQVQTVPEVHRSMISGKWCSFVVNK